MAIEDIMPGDPLFLGDFVRDSYGRMGRIYKIDHSCEMDEDWIAEQGIPVTEEQRDERWCHVLVEGGGAIVSPESKLVWIGPGPRRHESYELRNDWERYYFRDAYSLEQSRRDQAAQA